MKKAILLGFFLFSCFFLTYPSSSGKAIFKIGPALSFGKFQDLSAESLLDKCLPGVELAVRCAERFEVWGAYKFSKTHYRMENGSDRIFRLDAFAAGLRFKPVRIAIGEPFIGVGLNYYHFAGDLFPPFAFPVNSAIGPCIQGGFYILVLRPLQIQCAVKYNMMRHTETRKTDRGTYHYQTDFSGLEFGVELLLWIRGK
jgi:hypothetical protein